MKTIFTCLLLLAGLFGNQAQAQCQASFNASVSPNGGVTFTNTSTGGVAATWDFGDGTASNQWNPPVHQYNNTGYIVVCLTIFDSLCQSTTCDTVVLGSSSSCTASFSSQNVGLQYYFYGYVTFGGANATYTWDFGDSTVGTGASPQHTYAAAGTYTVCVTVTTSTGCTDTYCGTVTANPVNSICNASFSASANGVISNTIAFTNLSTGSTNYSWDFGDGTSSTAANPTHTYATPGSYVACLTIGTPVDSCYDIFCDSIYIPNNSGTCSALFGYQNVGNIYNFTGNGVSTLYHYWSFGDGTFSYNDNPSHTYAGPGTYQVCHTVSDSINTCTDTYCTTITIASSPCNINYTYVTDTTGTIFAFTGNTNGGSLGQLVWSFGDGTSGTGNQVTHAYTSSGWYAVCLSILSPSGVVLCSYCDSIVVGTPVNSCVPTFYSFPDSSVVGNGNVYFGVYNPCGNTQFVWDFGDSTTGSGTSPVHNYADSGWYYVCVTAYTQNGTFQFCDSVYSFRLATGITENAASIGLTVYPNPMHGTGTASFVLKQTTMVSVDLLDMQGKTVTVVYEGNMGSGTHNIALNNETLQSGIYILRINVDGTQIHQRIVVY